MNIKLFYSLRLYGGKKFGYPEEHSLVPPFGIATLKSFLNINGISVDQDDLDVKVWYDNKYSKKNSKRVNVALFDDSRRIREFIKKGKDNLLEKEAEKILEKTNYKGYDIFGFSIVDDHNFSAIEYNLNFL